MAQAYAVQRLNLTRRIDQGAVLRGHKIGLTSAPMQPLLGVGEPDFGYILDDMVLPDGADGAGDRFCAPRVEPEVAFLLRAPLRGPGVTVDDVLAATEAVAPHWRSSTAGSPTGASRSRHVADNASSGAVVSRPVGSDPRPGAAARNHRHLAVNGTGRISGLGSAVMGDPAAAVAWLANALARFGTEIEPGQFVMSGFFTTASFVAAGDHASAVISGLGTVTVSFN